MNTLIQKFADQAEDYADSMVDQGSEFHPTYTKKLVELIVQKCIEICRDVDGVDDHSMRVSRQDCACEIRDYFGVEERE